MDFIYVLGNGAEIITQTAGYSNNSSVIAEAGSYSQLSLSTNAIILLAISAILIIGFILYRRRLKNKYS